uniref:PEP-CTERM putative exosortase interaction domain-containing protein n=1 Tax=Desulfovibrio sp. U5L TaxID=596152 RepID=I2PZ91_9BACT
MQSEKHILSTRSIFLQGVLVALFLFLAASAQASIVTYGMEFTDSTTGALGVGSFHWNTDTEMMTDLNWNFSGKTGAVLDNALAKIYQSWNPLATTYGELFYRFLTDPIDYLASQYNPLSIAVGLMPTDVTGDFGFIAFGAEQGSTKATYLFYNPDWSVASEGYASAAPTPEPATMLLLGSGLAGLLVGRRRMRTPA